MVHRSGWKYFVAYRVFSIRALKKLGFAEEGSSPKYLKINGMWEDHIHYVLLNNGVE
jgi:ribosomal-protein-alanine N-acetyltransferase